jgi:excisionase family DNA binding protein
MTEELLTAKEAAKFLKMNYYYLMRLASQGIIPSYQKGRKHKRYFLKSELIAWLKGENLNKRREKPSPGRRGRKPSLNFPVG